MSSWTLCLLLFRESYYLSLSLSPHSKWWLNLLSLFLQGNSSYQFGFDVKDDEYTNYQNRKEVRDGNVIKGSYSVVDSDGFIRTVTYTADPKEGFKADVVREPTDIVVKIPTPAPENSLSKLSRPQPHFLPQQSQYRQPSARQQQPQQLRQPIQVEPQQQQQYQYE